MKTVFKILTLTILIALYSCKEKVKESYSLVLPVFGEKKLGGTSEHPDTIYHTVGPFKLTNQFREEITQETTKDKIYIADFFFATCQSICPKMSTQLSRLQDSIMSDNDIIILSHTVNPGNDTVEVLSQYGGKYGAIKGKWHLLTGPKKEIYQLAKTSYLVNALEDDGSEEGFLHSELFLLVDKQKRIRGLYDGTDSLQVNKLIRDIKLLKTEKTKTTNL